MQLFSFELTWFSWTYVVVSSASLPALFLQLNQRLFLRLRAVPGTKTKCVIKPCVSVVFSLITLRILFALGDMSARFAL